ncbi:MAG: enolase superfamily enzyme related to L-alanine-DL-glutamate epimerase [Verrucomicrobiales bacterium]|nr:enolase superfamily enzyme related to L-alanine-DL-glutamate epimerase [Verrucomicrobiales bacterium]
MTHFMQHPTKPTDIRTTGARLYFLPVHTRVPLKFGAETVTYVTCARTRVTVVDRRGNSAQGWGETPLSVQWVWPSAVPYEIRHGALKDFCIKLAGLWSSFDGEGHPMEIGWDFQEKVLREALRKFNEENAFAEPMPWLAALVCCSLFDIAVHDAYGNLHQQPIYKTYNAQWMNRSLESFLVPAVKTVSFVGQYPEAYFVPPATKLPAWHLVGGLDLLDASEATGNEVRDGYPVLLTDWITRDGLKCLKIKLRGNDSVWDYARLIKVGGISLAHGVQWLSADFNCTVKDPAYVNEILDRLAKEHPNLFKMILYVEQPFPYELEFHPIVVHSVSERKPLFLDESAHDWRMVKFGRELGWTGVALKTCKTQTGAILSACWAKAHKMDLMVQDLTNPMLAQIPHVQLAANVGTIMGVETNAMQFYPEASAAEGEVHPGIYQRRNGEVDLATISGSGFGYRVDEIERELPSAAAQFGN